MKILLLSDTHGELAGTRKVIFEHRDVDMMIHLGDIGFDIRELSDFIVVKGNHDKTWNLPRERVVEVMGHRILCMHGDMLEAKTVEEVFAMKTGKDIDIMQLCMETLYKNIAQYAKSKNCDVAFFGHSHLRIHVVREGVTLVNPGSLLFGMDGNDKSYAMVELQEKDIQVKFYNLEGEL